VSKKGKRRKRGKRCRRKIGLAMGELWKSPSLRLRERGNSSSVNPTKLSLKERG